MTDERTTAWERAKAGSQAAIITGQLAWQAAAPIVPPVARPDVSLPRDVAPTHLQLPSMQDLTQDAADWQEQQIQAERKRDLELGYQLRDPDVREERDR